MRHVVSALCTRALIDQVTQSVSLIELIDSVAGPIDSHTEGAFPLAADFLTIWSREDLQKPETSRGRLSLFNASNQAIGEPLVYEVDLTVVQRSRNVTRFPGFPFRGTGLHRLVVEVEAQDGGWRPVGEWPLMILAVTAEAAGLT